MLCALLRRFVVVLVVVVGCASSAPSRDAADVLAAYKSSNRRIAASGAAPRPWAVGQWTLYKVSDGKHAGYKRQAIVARDGCGFWLETAFVTGRYEERVVDKTCFRTAPDLTKPVTAQLDNVEAAMMRMGQRTIVVDFRKGLNPRTKALMKATLESSITLAWQSPEVAERRDVEVPAGVFGGAGKIVTRVWIEQSLHGLELWVHPEVPLGGVISSHADDGSEAVLLDYGLTGAVGELPDFDEHLRETGLE